MLPKLGTLASSSFLLISFVLLLSFDIIIEGTLGSSNLFLEKNLLCLLCTLMAAHLMPSCHLFFSFLWALVRDPVVGFMGERN